MVRKSSDVSPYLRHDTNSSIPKNLKTKAEFCENNLHSFPSEPQGGPGKEAHRQLTVNVNRSSLPYNPTPTYLGVKLDRQLTYRQHLELLCAKVFSRNKLLRRLAGSSWGASPSTLIIGALTLVYMQYFGIFLSLVVPQRTPPRISSESNPYKTVQRGL